MLSYIGVGILISFCCHMLVLVSWYPFAVVCWCWYLGILLLSYVGVGILVSFCCRMLVLVSWHSFAVVCWCWYLGILLLSYVGVGILASFCCHHVIYQIIYFFFVEFSWCLGVLWLQSHYLSANLIFF